MPIHVNQLTILAHEKSVPICVNQLASLMYGKSNHSFYLDDVLVDADSLLENDSIVSGFEFEDDAMRIYTKH